MLNTHHGTIGANLFVGHIDAAAAQLGRRLVGAAATKARHQQRVHGHRRHLSLCYEAPGFVLATVRHALARWRQLPDNERHIQGGDATTVP